MASLKPDTVIGRSMTLTSPRSPVTMTSSMYSSSAAPKGSANNAMNIGKTESRNPLERPMRSPPLDAPNTPSLHTKCPCDEFPIFVEEFTHFLAGAVSVSNAQLSSVKLVLQRNARPLYWPTDNVSPERPSTVSIPSGRLSINSLQPAVSSASCKSESVASGFAIRRFSRIVSERSTCSWNT